MTTKPASTSLLSYLLPPTLIILSVVVALWLLCVRYLKHTPSEFLMDSAIAIGAIVIHLILDRSLKRLSQCFASEAHSDCC